MSNATLVLASNMSGLREYLEGSGIYVPPRNPMRLTETIESLLENTNLLEGLGKKGRELAGEPSLLESNRPENC
jgi:glycosyltransferase involved in cell wall biosynthesis